MANDDRTTGDAPDASPQAPPDPLIGTTPLGQYRITRKIGEGGFGAVYLADQLGLKRQAVIKVMRGDRAGSEMALRRFQREAEVLAALDHQHLIKVYSFGEAAPGQHCLAMEYGGDRTLNDELERSGPLALDRALAIAGQICLALHEAHSKGVVHRDLKPSNIMLGVKDGGDWVKVVDVGIAKLLGEAESKITVTGAVIGTPAYLSPEQARGVELDGRSDQYATGCVLYEMISGQRPYDARSQLDFIRAHCVDEPISLAARGVEVPLAVSQLIGRALQKDPAARFASAKEMGEAIAAARAMLAAPEPRRRKWMAPAAAFALTMLAGGMLLYLAGRRQPEVAIETASAGISPAPAKPVETQPPAAGVIKPPPEAKPPVRAAAKPKRKPPPAEIHDDDQDDKSAFK